MAKVRFLSITEQVAEHLRKEIQRGCYGEYLPGVRLLADELGVDMKTVNASLNILESEHLLIPQGAGRQRRINPHHRQSRKTLRIEILLYERGDYQVSYYLDIRHRLESAGHSVSFSTKTLEDLGMDVGRVARHVRSVDADAWIVSSGNRAVLRWFHDQMIPVFALFGAVTSSPIAGTGPNKYASLVSCIEYLAKLGHRRIVMITRETSRKPALTGLVRRVLETMETLNIPVGPYNIPDWEESRQGFHEMLGALFKHTPPTALLVDGTPFYFAAQNFIAQRGLRIPDDVSLISLDPDPLFAWAEPQISHIHWDSKPWVKHIVQWARRLAANKEDKRQQFTDAEFIPGGTVGPAPGIRNNG